jgi:AcrR family transcriptional regulator
MNRRTEGAVSVTAKGRARREQIVAAATTLFHDHGYHATGIDAIGEAAGITGPGVYRHFSGKDEILTTIFDRMWMRLRAGIEMTDGLGDSDALVALIDHHVAYAVSCPAEMALLYRELPHLPAEYQERAGQNRARYERAWAARIVGAHPGLSDPVAEMMARSVFWLINAYALEGARRDVGPDEAGSVLRAMALAATRARLDHDPSTIV